MLNHTKCMGICHVALFGCTVFNQLCLNVRSFLSSNLQGHI